MFKSIDRLMSIGVSLSILLATMVVPSTAYAADTNPAYCDPDVPRLTNANFGNEVPVIMVHGFNGKYQDWGSVSDAKSFAGRVDAIPGVAVAHLYGYKTFDIADLLITTPRLIHTIDCVAQISQNSGSKGKVILVGYSLGGLIARDALNSNSSDGQRAIADEVGQVITIGSPHDGTTTLPLQVPGWENIPHFPSQTTVHTIAGDVTRVYYDMRGNEIKREQPHDDTLVTVASAHAEHSDDVNRGGGQTTVSCEKPYLGVPNLNWYIAAETATCEHTQLIGNSLNGVREDTIDAIEKYVTSLSEPAGISLTVGGLTTTYDSRWTNVDYGASGPGQDSSAMDTTNGATCTNCTTSPPPTVYAHAEVVNTASWCSGSAISCAVGSYETVGPAPDVTIGGRTPDSSARYYDSGYDGTSLVWCFETEQVCVHYRRAVDTPQLEPSQALLDLFSTATWASSAN